MGLDWVIAVGVNCRLRFGVRRVLNLRLPGGGRRKGRVLVRPVDVGGPLQLLERRLKGLEGLVTVVCGCQRKRVGGRAQGERVHSTVRITGVALDVTRDV